MVRITQDMLLRGAPEACRKAREADAKARKAARDKERKRLLRGNPQVNREILARVIDWRLSHTFLVGA